MKPPSPESTSVDSSGCASVDVPFSGIDSGCGSLNCMDTVASGIIISGSSVPSSLPSPSEIPTSSFSSILYSF